MLIAGDIGGTKSHLVAYEETTGKLEIVARQRYATRDFSSFEKLIGEFSRHAAGSAKNAITGAGFGVPGTVVDGRLHAAHVPWVLDSASLAASLGSPVLDGDPVERCRCAAGDAEPLGLVAAIEEEAVRSRTPDRHLTAVWRLTHY